MAHKPQSSKAGYDQQPQASSDSYFLHPASKHMLVGWRVVESLSLLHFCIHLSPSISACKQGCLMLYIAQFGWPWEILATLLLELDLKTNLPIFYLPEHKAPFMTLNLNVVTWHLVQ